MSEMYRSALKLQYELEMDLSFTQWLPKLSYQVQGPYADIECKQTTKLLGSSRYVYSNLNTARRAGTRLKRLHCATPVFSLVVQATKVTISLCCIVKESRNNSPHADSPYCCKHRHTIHANTGRAANIVTPYMRILGVCCKHRHTIQMVRVYWACCKPTSHHTYEYWACCVQTYPFNLQMVR
ncbi:hypothetical protein TNCV_2768831 [Trichonephila clavipes]|nr:hypothetical protein TNCV_2768831 [Trichonephila clavipes]